MALTLLLEALAQQGDAEARQLVDTARAQAEAVRKAAEARAERQCADALVSRETAIRVEQDARRAGAVRDARARVLAARSAFLEKVFAAAERSLPGVLDDPSSREALLRLCREALECFDAAAVRIRCRSSLAMALRGDAIALGAELVADDDTPEGIVAEAVDGSCRVDNTLVARLHRFRPALSILLTGAVSAREAA